MPRPAQQIVDGMKPCSMCKEVLPLDRFHKAWDRSTGYQPACISCRKEKYDLKGSVMKHKYGITGDQYKEMYEAQEGRCFICSVHHDVLCVDHDHTTKQVRGLLCRECNFGLGKFGDDPNRLMAAASYLLSQKGE